MLRRTLFHMGLDDANVDKSPLFKHELLEDDLCTIYPCVHKFLKLEFPLEENYDENIRKILTTKAVYE